MISQSSNQQRVINCTLVSQRPDVMWVWQVDRIKTIPSDCWCGQVRVCLCVCFFWVHRKPSGSGASHGTVPACRIRTGRSWIQITAHTHKHTQYHLRLTHTHTHPHTCSSITQMLWENALIATCSCQSNFFLFVLSIFFFFFYVQSQPGQQRNPPPLPPPGPLETAQINLKKCEDIQFIKTGRETDPARQCCSAEMKNYNWCDVSSVGCLDKVIVHRTATILWRWRCILWKSDYKSHFRRN